MYNDDTRGLIYWTIGVFLVGLVIWLGFILVSACGFGGNCVRGTPLVVRTPIPTLIPVGHVERQQPGAGEMDFNKCRVEATALIAAWVQAGHTESEAFGFTDLDGQECQGTFEEDVRPLFTENSMWFAGALSCTSCHNAALSERGVGLDLTSFESVELGSRRVPESTSPGTDIFGRGEWEQSRLYDVLVNRGLTNEGHPADVEPPQAIIYAGQLVAGAEAEGTRTPEATATPTP